MSQLQLDAIRHAVASDELEKARQLWEECAGEVAAELRDGSVSAARMAELREFVEWARPAVQCARAHIQDRLSTLHVASEYAAPEQAPAHRLVDTSF